jgi:hypothetical protein
MQLYQPTGEEMNRQWVIMPFAELFQVFKQGVQAGALEVAVSHGIVKSEVNMTEACRLYGKERVSSWINSQKIRPIDPIVGKGHRRKFYRTDLEAADKAERMYQMKIYKPQ